MSMSWRRALLLARPCKQTRSPVLSLSSQYWNVDGSGSCTGCGAVAPRRGTPSHVGSPAGGCSRDRGHRRGARSRALISKAALHLQTSRAAGSPNPNPGAHRGPGELDAEHAERVGLYHGGPCGAGRERDAVGEPEALGDHARAAVPRVVAQQAARRRALRGRARGRRREARAPAPPPGPGRKARGP
jgi:hypothetical protein